MDPASVVPAAAGAAGAAGVAWRGHDGGRRYTAADAASLAPCTPVSIGLSKRSQQKLLTPEGHSLQQHPTDEKNTASGSH